MGGKGIFYGGRKWRKLEAQFSLEAFALASFSRGSAHKANGSWGWGEGCLLDAGHDKVVPVGSLGLGYNAQETGLKQRCRGELGIQGTRANTSHA